MSIVNVAAVVSVLGLGTTVVVYEVKKENIKKIFYHKEVYEKFWENVNGCWIICQRKIEYVIRN